MDPLVVNEEEACRLLSCGKNRLYELRRHKKLKQIGQQWYAVEDLKECVELLRKERDKDDNVRHIESAPKKERAMGSEKGRPGYKSPGLNLRENGARSA